MAPVTAILLQVNTLELMGPRAIAATRGTKRSGGLSVGRTKIAGARTVTVTLFSTVFLSINFCKLAKHDY